MTTTAITVTVDIEVWECARCRRKAPIEPVDITRDIPEDPERWRARSHQYPRGWQRFYLTADGSPGVALSAYKFCPDCWPTVRARLESFLAGAALR